ncbi:hypothetical protein SAMN02745165_01425 [Malonomonas rubra DSM 5091]|uniref:Uncharacterized protein n=1 Tax=Malonomonas rubra DSM 5091 TaxID=1122189 RepID=A0A1M6G632_MALRU|nr:hypothetical protein [Malonomonas rubra]SHJ05399.1 hypothetical protein SAMN02745165_01425 [Malonomonas rubra DSM 5091]
MSRWPAALRLKTRKILDGIDPFPGAGILRMKNISNFSAYLKQADLRNGQIILYDSETQLATNYRTAGEMFDAGWIADLTENAQFRLLSRTDEMAESSAPTGAAMTLTSHKEFSEASRVVSLMPRQAEDRA